MASHTLHTVNAVLTAAKKMKRKYTQAVKACHPAFSPFTLLVGGVMVWESLFVGGASLTRQLSNKWGKPYGEVLGWVQNRLLFAILRATNYCVRGSRMKWRSKEWHGGWGRSGFDDALVRN